MLVIGGGATGAGVALDGAARGLKVALVEREDFAAGTSSKSTKLLHGGVRYLEKAFMNLDWSQFELVKEALSERDTVLQIAPHLCQHTAIMVPLYQWWQVPYYWAGLKVYELIARCLSGSLFAHDPFSSYYMARQEVVNAFPLLDPAGLVGAVVYYDGQFDDAGLNLAVALTAVEEGAALANHVEVRGLLKDAEGLVAGAEVVDRETGEKFSVRAKTVVNATGAFCDAVRKYDDPSAASFIEPSAGIHITLPGYFTPRDIGLLNPKTSDGRVIFLLPWEGVTLVGTTDTPSALSFEPTADTQSIEFVLAELRKYLSPGVTVSRKDVLSAWSGIRPLVRSGEKGSTQEIVRSHLISRAPSGLVTVTGGKWTTYRRMAEETVDEASKAAGVAVPPARTQLLPVRGAEGYHRGFFALLIQHHSLPEDVARYLAHRYGSQAGEVAALATEGGARQPKRLHPGYPFLEAQVTYAVRHEYACTAVDVLARRTRLAFVDSRAAKACIPTVVGIMAKELQWTKGRVAEETRAAEAFVTGMIVD